MPVPLAEAFVVPPPLKPYCTGSHVSNMAPFNMLRIDKMQMGSKHRHLGNCILVTQSNLPYHNTAGVRSIFRRKLLL